MANQPKKYQKFVATAATATLVASAIVPVASADAGFTDISNYDAEVQGYINDLADRGIIKGTSETTFAPSTHISRGQVVKLLGRYLEEEQGYEIPEDWEDSRFDDVDVTKDAELAKYAALVYDAGVFTGNNGNLEATKKISRQNMAVVLDRAVEAITGTSLVELAAETDEEANVADLETAKESARDAIEALNILGISTVENFNPLNNVSRANFAKFLYLTIEQIGAEVDYLAELEEALEALADLGEVTEDNAEEAQELVDAAQAALDAAVEAEAIDEEAAEEAQAAIDAVQAAIDAIDVVTEAHSIKVTAKDAVVAANGADNTVITFEIIGENGKVDTDADDIVLEIGATFGNLANNRVTVQNGVGQVVLSSEFSTQQVVAKITAQIIEASENYKDLIGKLTGETTVTFSPSAVTTDPNTVTFQDAESNQADRVVLYFDKAVGTSTFVKTNADGTFQTDVTGTRQILKDNVSIKVMQNGNLKTVVGIVPVQGNDKAVEVLLDKGTILTDNAIVDLDVEIGTTRNQRFFTLTDARQPEFTSVKATNLRTLELKFSESVWNGNFSIDGLWDDKRELNVKFGEFDAKTATDNRATAKVLLNAVDGKQLYFTPGNHSITVTQLKDFAAQSDNANVSTTQTLNFSVAADTTAPIATATVESPEQFRLTFNKDVDALVGNAAAADVEELFNKAFKVYNETTKQWVDFSTHPAFKQNNVALNDILAVDVVRTATIDNQYVVELKEDWTQILAKSTDAYYNYKFKFDFAADSFVSLSNGVKNAKFELDLNYNGSALNAADNVSPVIADIVQTVNHSTYEITMNEPVKLAGKDTATSLTSAIDTVSTQQTTGLPKVLAEFQGTDKDGKAVVIAAQVQTYTDINKADMKFHVTTSGETLQSLVDAKGYNENWKVVVRSISDDIGNTAATLTKDFVVKSTAVPVGFQIRSHENRFANQVFAWNAVDASSKDVLEVTFTKGINVAGPDNLTSVYNWTLNGTRLSNLSNVESIRVSDVDGNTNNGYEKVIITFADDRAFGANSNVVSVTKGIKSLDGTNLTGEHEVVAETITLTADYLAARNATNLIYNLPAVSALTAANATQVAAAKAAYDALTANQKALVSADAVTTLNAAVAKIAELTGGQPVTLESLQAAIVNNGFGANVVTVNSNNLPANLKGAEGYVVTIGNKEYTLTQSANKPENWSVTIPATEATEAQIKAGTIEAVVAPTAPFVGTVINNGFGANVVTVNANNLPEALKGKTSYTLTVEGTEYALKQSSNKPENWSVTIPATEATEAQIKAGTVSGK